MENWIMNQLQNFNIFMIFFILFFQVTLQQRTVDKLLKEQSDEIYNEMEELKDEIRGNKK